METGGDGIDTCLLFDSLATVQAVFEIGPDREVWKQREMLKDEPDGAALGWNVLASGRVVEDAVADRDTTRLRANEPGNRAKQRGFPGPGCPEQNRDARRRDQFDVEREPIGEPRVQRRVERHAEGATAHGL